MKKHNFKKILSFFLVAIMLCSAMIIAIPVSAAVDTPIYLVPNEDNWINGVLVRFETSGTGTYAKIENGKLELEMVEGDLLWFPELTVKDTTSQITYEMTCNRGQAIVYNVTGITSRAEGKKMYASSFGNYQGWICPRLMWNDGGATTISSYDAWYTKTGSDGSTSFPASANPIFESGEKLTTTTTFTQGATAIRPNTSFQEGNMAEPYLYVWGDKDNVDPYGSFGIGARNALNISIESVGALNINGNGGSYSEDFETIDSYSGPIINMRQVNYNVEFDSGIGFIDFMFQLHANVTPDTDFVAKKNGEEVARVPVSSFTAVDEVYTYSTYFMTVDFGDALTVCLEKDGKVLGNSTYDIEYGAIYEDYLANPPSPTDEDLINIAYSESFDTAIVLEPGENIVNGHKWTYIRNSADGSAVIKDGRLYFTGSNNDMIIFNDINVNKISYAVEYEVTYLDTPSDDNWENWTCWFGGFYHLAAADADGNRFAYVTSVTPNDVYMMKGNFGADGAFTRDEQTDHAIFPNVPATPTQPGELYYWNGRLGNGTPTKVRTCVGVSGYSYSGVGIAAYSVTGSHQVSANMAGGANGVPTMDQRVGEIGFVCSESKVSVIVDNLVVKTKGKSIVVDGQDLLVSADGEVSVSNIQRSDKKLVYTTVDGAVKYMGDTFAATKLTNITTTQVGFTTRKVAADGQTGLKWSTEINKSDYEKLLADPNISKVEVGTVVVSTADAKQGITLEKATSNIAGTATANGDLYTFEGVLDIDKEARDTSYSGIGYIKVTMTDGKEVVVYSDYVARNHAYALSDLVEEFTDDEPTDDNGNNTTSPDNTATDAPDATDGTTEEKKGCGSSVAGLGVVIVVALTAICFVTKKTKENNI